MCYYCIIMRNKKFLRLFLFYSGFVWFYTFSYSMVPANLFAQGLHLPELVFGQWIRFGAQLVVIPFLVFITARMSWLIALICSFLYVLFSIKIFTVNQYYLATVLSGFNVSMFYVFYNFAHFRETPKEKTGTSSSLMFSIPVLIGVVTPLLAGVIMNRYGNLVWVFSLLFFIISVSLIKIQSNFRMRFSVKKALAELKPTRVYLFLDGVWEALQFGFIPFFTLKFIHTSLGYGAFLSYMALTGAVAGLLLGPLTDRLKKRAVFMYPITVFMALVTLFFIKASGNIILWIIAVGLVQFILPLFWNVLLSLIVDIHENIELAMVGREICLAAGKFVGLALVFGSFILEPKPFVLFILLACAVLAIGLKLYWDTRITKSLRIA